MALSLMPNVITSLSTCGTTLQGNIMQRESHVAQARQQGKLRWEAASPSLPSISRRLRGSPPVRPSVPRLRRPEVGQLTCARPPGPTARARPRPQSCCQLPSGRCCRRCPPGLRAWLRPPLRREGEWGGKEGENDSLHSVACSQIP